MEKSVIDKLAIEKIRGLKNELDQYFMTGEEFQHELSGILDKLEKGATFDIKLIDKDKKEYCFGREGEGECANFQKKDLEDGYSFQVRIWGNAGKEWADEIVDLFSAFINSSYCDGITGLPATDRGQLIQKCNDTLRLWLEKGKKVAVFMIDLDHFKEVNLKKNHIVGTAVLSEFSRLLFRVTNRKGILIHQSGDEFDVLYPYEHPYEVVEFAADMHEKVKGHKFTRAEEVNLTMAMGVRLIEGENLEFSRAREAAENAYAPKQQNVEKHRDSIRLEKQQNNANYGRKSLELAIVRTWNCQEQKIFRNPYLDYIVKLAEKSELSEIQARVRDFIDWVKPEWTSNMRCTCREEGWDVKAEFSAEEVGLAVLRGILQKKEMVSHRLKYTAAGEVPTVNVFAEGQNVFSYPTKENRDFCWEGVNSGKDMRLSDVRRTVLIQAGNNVPDLPGDVFYKVIYVDTRPTSSGNLPDFWAATLSELISLMKKNRNLINIVIFGDTGNTQRVLDYLDHIDKWSSSAKKSNIYRYKYISRKTYQTVEDIMAFHKKFNKNIVKCCSEDELIRNIYQVFSAEVETETEEPEEEPILVNRFLERKLSYDEIKLDIVDGCRTESIAVAFPTVLEIIRNTYRREPERKLRDQNGRNLFELTDFKIVLEKPTYNKLPGYYYDDESELKEYYKKTLGTDEGLFRKLLVESGQMPEMIRHIVTAIKSEKSYSTRRAILVVPITEIADNKYLPLGLVDVWFAPRYVGEKTVIDCSFTWRTVEAIVGLPYSMYASVTFAEDMIRNIGAEVEKQGSTVKTVELGQVSYIAHSMHMFLDEASMNIVRGIVDEVSI